MTAERYLEMQAKRAKQAYLEALPSPRLPSLDVEHVPLRDAPAAFRRRLEEIMRPPDVAANQNQSSSQLGKVVFAAVDVVGFDSGITDYSALSGHAATIVGSSQQGKTSLLNSLLSFFGFIFDDDGINFPDADLLPTHSKNRVGLPFPLRIEYGSKYELHLQRWGAMELEAMMCKAAEKALAQDEDFFENLDNGFDIVTPGSFLEFVAEHGEVDQQQGYSPRSSAVEALQADDGLDVHDFTKERSCNPSIEVHDAVFKFLVDMVEDGCWFRYKQATLKCPSQLLKYLTTNGCESGAHAYVLDLPGVGIVDDNNSLVEELVLRDVRDANTIIVLTGERSFTQDVLHILKSSVFERLLDPEVTPPPTVAVTNSRKLRGLKEEEMDIWRTATLEGTLGWNVEVEAFAAEVFTERRHRDLASIKPELFPNDLTGFLESGIGADEKGVSMLVGYFLRLPQESLVASVNDVLERGRAVMQLVDQLWQANAVSWHELRPSRLTKEAKMLRDEQFQKNLNAELTLACQRKMFGFETDSIASDARFTELQKQMDYIDELFTQQLQKLGQKFEKLKDDSVSMKQELPKVVKESLVQIASQWDENVGKKAFERFLLKGQQISMSIFETWANKMFHMDARGIMEDPKQGQACRSLLKYLKGNALKTINSENFKYTWTHWLRLQAWNLDLKDVTKTLGVRRGRSSPAVHKEVWSSVEELVKSKWRLFRDQMLDHMSLKSASIKQLVSRLKIVITTTFEDCMRNFHIVMDALERIAKGQLAISEDPVVIFREELGTLTGKLERYLDKHRKMRDGYGAQELKRLLEIRSKCPEESIDAKGVVKACEWLFGDINQAILDVGPSNVLQVIIDNATNCVAVGRLIEEEFPHIGWTPCATHCLDLLLEDIGKLPWVIPTVETVREIIKFVSRKQRCLAISGCSLQMGMGNAWRSSSPQRHDLHMCLSSCNVF